MTPDEAIGQATTGGLKLVYLVLGEERYFRDRVVAALRAAALDGGVPAFNEDKFTAGETDVDRVLSAVRTVPMMAKRRFVLVRSLERWDSSEGPAKESSREPPLDALAEYAKAPIDSTCLVLVAEKLDGRRKLSALAKKQGIVVDCGAIEGRALPGWIRDEAKAKGHVMERESAELLAEIGGPELSRLEDALERLSLFVGPGAPIDASAISECVTRVRLEDTWALVDAVGKRDLSRAMDVLSDVFDPRDRGLPLLGALAWSVRQLARFQAALEGGAREDEAARIAGVFQSFRVRELASKARAVRSREVERWLLVLAETDVALKSSRRSPDAILTDMLLSLCRREAGAARSRST